MLPPGDWYQLHLALGHVRLSFAPEVAHEAAEAVDMLRVGTVFRESRALERARADLDAFAQHVKDELSRSSATAP